MKEKPRTSLDWSGLTGSEVFTEDMFIPSPGKKSTTVVLPSASGYPCLSQLTPSSSQLATERGISGKKDNYIANRAGWIAKHAKRIPWDTVTLSHQASTPDTADLGCKKAMTVAVEVLPNCLGIWKNLDFLICLCWDQNIFLQYGSGQLDGVKNHEKDQLVSG